MKCEMFQYFRASDPSLAACTLVAGTSRRDKATPKPCTNSSPPASIRPYKCSRLPSSQRCWRCRFQRTRSPLQRFKPYRQHQRARRRNGLPMPTSLVRWSARRSEKPNRLVVVCQPLARPDPNPQRDRIAVVLRARNGDESPPAGLSTANFFANRDGPFVLNLAEWTSATAHRDALAQASYGQHRLVVALARDARSSSGYRSRRNSPLSAARDRAGRRDSLNKTWSMR